MLKKNDLDKGAAKSFDKQSVSACVDSELEAFATESSFAFESEEMQLWSRYHLIGQVMRDEAQHLDMDISSRINEQIAKEPVYTASPAKPKSNVITFPTNPFKQLAGYAIAASVALVVLFNVGTQSQVDSQSTTLAAVSSTNSQASSNAMTTNTQASNLSMAERQELQTIHDMFLKHESLSHSSLLPSVQVVSNQKVIPVSVPMLAEQTLPQESMLQGQPSPEIKESEQEGAQ